MPSKGVRACLDCGRLIRREGTSAAEFPGTIVGQGDLCSRDYQRRYRPRAGKKRVRKSFDLTHDVSEYGPVVVMSEYQERVRLLVERRGFSVEECSQVLGALGLA